MRKAVFDGVDHVEVTRAVASDAVRKYRFASAEAVAGKKVFELDECRSIALSNNLDLHAARLEEIARSVIERSNRHKLLPRASWSGEMSERDNTMFSYSDPMGREGQSPEPAQGSDVAGVNVLANAHERSTWKNFWEAKWSPTEAALAFYLARSARNDAIKAHYQRVRTAQKLIGVIDASYYRLLALQASIPIAQELVGVSRAGADKMDKLLAAQLKTAEDHHRARQRVIKARSILQGLENALERERNTLASAMAISPGKGTPTCDFWVLGCLSSPCFSADPCELEMKAVMHRPEAYQAGLNHLNSVNDLQRAIVKYFPKVTGFLRWTRDKDKYMLNKDWKEYGVYAYVDILDFVINRDEHKAISVMVSKTQREVAAIALGITSEVRISLLKYLEAGHKLSAAQESLAGSEKLLRMVSERTDRDAGTALAVDEARAGVLQERIEEMTALGEVNAALASLQSAVGTNYTEALPECR